MKLTDVEAWILQVRARRTTSGKSLPEVVRRGALWRAVQAARDEVES